jgi:hypothetical protein
MTLGGFSMMKLPFAVICFVTLNLAVPSGIIASPVVKHQLSEADAKQIDAMGDQFFSELKEANVDKAVTGFLGNTGLMEGKKAEIAQLAGQINTIINIYGSISNCVLVQSDGRGGVVEQRQFICQHEKLATRWKLLFVKSTKGWVAGNLYFDDKVMNQE